LVSLFYIASVIVKYSRIIRCAFPDRYFGGAFVGSLLGGAFCYARQKVINKQTKTHKTQTPFYFRHFFAIQLFHAQDKKTAEECFSKANYKCAEEQYTKLAEKEQIQKFQSEYYDKLGTSQRRLGKTAQAFKSYESALKSNPKSVSVYENLASLHNQKGNKTKALEYINTGISLEPESANLYLLRSKIYEFR
jgi:tetratricopeptide (TPR) repeat protein